MPQLVRITKDTIYGNTKGSSGILSELGNDGALTYKPVMVQAVGIPVAMENHGWPVILLTDDEMRHVSYVLRARIQGLYDIDKFDGIEGYVEDPEVYQAYGILKFYPDTLMDSERLGATQCDSLPEVMVTRDEIELISHDTPIYEEGYR